MTDNFSNKKIELKKRRFLDAVRNYSRTRDIPLPTVNFNGCINETQDQLAHYHSDTNVICVSVQQLHMLNFDDIEHVASHEVAHFFEQNHSEKFYKTQNDLKVKGWRPPHGTVCIREPKENTNTKQKNNVIKKPNPSRCNYHLCNKKTKTIQCRYCKDYFCTEHIKPTKPGMPNFNETTKENAVKLAEWRDNSGHPCSDYFSREREIEEQAKRNSNTFLLSNTEKMCDYCCQLDISASNGYRECKDCGKSFCERHIEKNNHECSSLESKSKANTCQYCKIHSAYRQYINCRFCKGFFCEYHLEPGTHNCSVWLNEERKRRNKQELEYEKIRKKTENERFIFNIIKLLAVVIILVGAYFAIKIYISENVCSGGVFPSTCSKDKPYYCSNGTLIEKASKCGCNNGLDVVNDSCIALPKCNDGTIEGTCSINKPLFCSNKTLIINASICGCPAEYSKNGDNCESIYGSGYETKPMTTYAQSNINPNSHSTSEEFTNEIESYILEYTNYERKLHNLKPLEYDEKLAVIARLHSQDMAKNNYFDHTNLEGDGPTERAEKQGYATTKSLGGGVFAVGIAENIGMMPTGNVEGVGYLSNNPSEIAQAQVTGWMNSPGHRANILDATYSVIGIGTAYDGIYYLSTQDFS